MSNTTKGAINQTVDKAKDATNQGFDKAKDVAGQAVDKAREAASTVGEMASNAAATAGRKADDLTSSAGTGIKNLSDTIRDYAPKEGVLGDASKAVAGTLRQGGKYLEEEGLSGMMEDVTGMIKKNPIPAILVGVGLGVLIGRLLRS